MPPRATLALVALLAIVALGGVVRAQAIGGNTHLSADEQGYVSNANRILAGRPYATFKWPPATSLTLALSTRLAGHRSLRLATHARGPAQYAQLALGVLALILIAGLAWAAAGPWPAVIATALAASYEPLVLATRTFLSEPAGALALLGAVGAAAWARARIGEPGPVSRSPSPNSPSGSAPNSPSGSGPNSPSSSGPNSPSSSPRRIPPLAALAGAGAIGGVACLTRGDLLVAMAVIAMGLALADRPLRRMGRRAGLRTAAWRGGAYVAGLLAVLSPWLAYAAASEGRFVPITTAGPDAFFVGTYLPGKGLLVPTEEALAPEVCRHFPSDCGPYWQRSSAPLFKLIRTRYPGASQNAAVMRANIENIRRYALGRPLAFASMLWGKFWSMWDHAWSGGNSGLHPDTSRAQHLIYLTIAWLGLLAGIALTRPAREGPRTVLVCRWALIVSAGALLSVAAIATLFNDQPRYNVSLMPLLFLAGSVGLWLAGERGWTLARARRLSRSG